MTPDEKVNGMTVLLSDLRSFHNACDVPVLPTPQFPSQERIRLRDDILQEEVNELRDAISENDIVEVADALADIVYVTVGTALEFGIPLDRVWSEVHRSNMAKVDPVTGKVRRRSDGKVLKPEGWLPPDIKSALTQENPDGR